MSNQSEGNGKWEAALLQHDNLYMIQLSFAEFLMNNARNKSKQSFSFLDARV